MSDTLSSRVVLVNSERENRKRREEGKKISLEEGVLEEKEGKKKDEELLGPQPFQRDLYFEGNSNLTSKTLIVDQ